MLAWRGIDPLKRRVSLIGYRTNGDQPVRSLSRSLSSDSNSLSSRRSADCNCCWCAREAARCAWNSSRAWSIASSGAPCSRAALSVASGWLEPSELCTKRLRLRASSSQASSFQYSVNLRTGEQRGRMQDDLGSESDRAVILREFTLKPLDPCSPTRHAYSTGCSGSSPAVCWRSRCRVFAPRWSDGRTYVLPLGGPEAFARIETEDCKKKQKRERDIACICVCLTVTRGAMPL